MLGLTQNRPVSEVFQLSLPSEGADSYAACQPCRQVDIEFELGERCPRSRHSQWCTDEAEPLRLVVEGEPLGNGQFISDIHLLGKEGNAGSLCFGDGSAAEGSPSITISPL